MTKFYRVSNQDGTPYILINEENGVLSQFTHSGDEGTMSVEKLPNLDQKAYSDPLVEITEAEFQEIAGKWKTQDGENLEQQGNQNAPVDTVCVEPAPAAQGEPECAIGFREIKFHVCEIKLQRPALKPVFF